MRIFITGSSGFIGQHLVERLKDGNELSFLKNDLRNHDAVRLELLSADPEVIVHLAARTEVEKSFYEQTTFSEINYVGTVNLIEAAKELKNLKNFVFASTMEVYGWQPNVDDVVKTGLDSSWDKVPCYNEETPPNPNAPYAVAKYACEKYLEYAQRSYGFPFTAIRQTNAYGRKDNDFFVTEQIITQMLKNPNEINLGSPEPYRNFIFIDDLIDAWVTVINNPDKCKNQIFCIGPDNAIRIDEYANMIAKKLNWEGKINWYTKPARPGEIYVLNSSNNKITHLTGWSPRVTIDEGLDRTIAIWKDKLYEVSY